MTSGLFNAGAANSLGDLSKDVQLNDGPKDSISDLKFSPQSNHLAVASWDKHVRIYEINDSGGVGRAAFEHQGPVLSCDWSKDGTKVVGAGTDKAARMIDLSGGSTARQVAVHEQPIRCARFFTAPNANAEMLVTGSWDKTVKYWDLRQEQPISTLTCQERVYTLDVKNELLVIGTADRYIDIVTLREPTKFFRTQQSPLKWQTRVVKCFLDASGFAIGSIEGRCAFQHIDEKDTHLNFSFKCHRDPPQGHITNVYSVNSISVHPEHSTFMTAGSDGTISVWDRVAKNRLKGYPSVGGSITCTDFDRSGNLFAYGVSYDWSKGYLHNMPQLPIKVMLHPVSPEEVKPRQAVKKR